MSGSETTHSGLTRRNFLKGSMALGLTSLAGCAPQSNQEELLADTSKTEPEEQVCSGVCRGGCAQGCFINYHVREGKIVRTSARDFVDPDYNRICIKGLSLPERIYSEERIKYPIKRVGERGSGNWERISWDEALSLIAGCWLENYEKHGSLCCGFATRTGQEGMLYQKSWARFKNLAGGVDLTLPADKHFGKALTDVVGSSSTGTANDDKDWANAKTMVFCGSSFTETTYHQWHWVYEAQQKGGKIIVIDPMFNGIAAKADKYIPIRPGTDAVLFMGMSKIALENDWVDWDFLKAQSVAPGLVRKDTGMLMRVSDITGNDDDDELLAVSERSGEWGPLSSIADPVLHGEHIVEGVPVVSPLDLLIEAVDEYTPEKVSEICDIPVADIQEVAELICKNGPVTFKIGLGPDHRCYGYEPYLASGTLAILTGNLGKEGASHGYFPRKISYESKAYTAPESLVSMGDYIAMAPSQFPQIMETGKYGDYDVPLKMLIVHGTDFVHTRGDRRKTLEAIDKLDLLVSINLVMNDTSLYSDIVLPVCEWCEYEEINGSRTYHPFLCYQDQVIDPQFESKSDFEIIKLLSNGLGHPEWFDFEASDALRMCYGDDRYERIRDEKCVYHDYFAEGGFRYIYGEDGDWGTTSGKLQFYVEDPGDGIDYEPYGMPENVAEQRLPMWHPPLEAWNEEVPGYGKNPLSETYPISIQAEHKKWNSQTCFSRVGLVRELDPEPTVYLSAKDAADRGIDEGDCVKAWNDRGYVVLRAHINNGLRPGFANMPNGWLADQYVDGHYCDLLGDFQDPNNENCNFSDVLVQIEKTEAGVSER